MLLCYLLLGLLLLGVLLGLLAAGPHAHTLRTLDLTTKSFWVAWPSPMSTTSLPRRTHRIVVACVTGWLW